MDPLSVFLLSVFGAVLADASRTRRSMKDFYPASAQRTLKPYQGMVSMRSAGVDWFVEPGLAVWIEAKYLRPMPGNIFDPDKLGSVAKAVRSARKEGRPIPLMAGYGQIWKIDTSDIAESQAYSDDGPPFSTSDPQLDDWLRRGEIDEQDDREENRRMKARLEQAVQEQWGDLGQWTARVRDGNHRTFGAVMGGEERVAVRLYDNDVQDIQMAVRAGEGASAYQRARSQQLQDLLRKAISDTNAPPWWLSEEAQTKLLTSR